MGRINKFLENKINDFSIRKKLVLFYVCCVLLPLFVTDGILFGILYSGEIREQRLEMEGIAASVQTDFSYAVKEAVKMANAIYINRSVNEFLDKEYPDGLSFYEAGMEVEKRNFYEAGAGYGSVSIVMCADNESIVNGSHFYRLSTVRNEEWCRKLLDADHDIVLSCYYTGDSQKGLSGKRKISLVRRLDYYRELACTKLVRIDLDYITLAKRMQELNYHAQVYLCEGDRIILSNTSYTGDKEDFPYLTGTENIGFETETELYEETIRILVARTDSGLLQMIREHFPMILFMIAVNILLPGIMAVVFHRSIVSRLMRLNNAFDEVELETLKEISDVSGKDEIGNLMHNYNRMVVRLRELIKTVYTDRMEKQKMDLARQKAELLALHSQINPHFLFNVLESIRMHSIMKGEQETACMIERLAVLERQNAEWVHDSIPIREELGFIDAYLKLQQYRFGDRLHYEITAQEECENYLVPKLTLATFTENACIHGVEKKTVPCYIYIRVYLKGDFFYMEIEDTGAGMDEEAVEKLREKIAVSDVEGMCHSEHVGIANACLRLKMVTDGRANFELESEKGAGTIMTIRVPVACLKTDESRQKGNGEMV